MAAMSSAAPPPPPLFNPVAVIGVQFCVPYPVDLTVTKKALSISDGDFAVTDVNGNVLFKVKGKVFSLHDRRLLLGADGTPILSMQQKIMSMHKRWNVFRGESSDEKYRIFNVRQSSLIQFKTELNVYLPHNTNEETCDFKIKGSYFDRSCTIFLGDSSTILAQMHREYTVKNIILGKDTFGVTVYPHVDYAFIATLIVILDEINKDKHDNFDFDI